MNTPVNSPVRNALNTPVNTPARHDPNSTTLGLNPEDTAIADRALQRSFNGMQFHRFFEGLHSLFHIGHVVITGSAAKSIHTQLNPDLYQSAFRSPNDIDVIVNTHRLASAPLRKTALLSQFGLRMPEASKPYILEYSNGGHNIKIDLIPSDTQMVRDEFDACETHGAVAISSLTSLNRLDRARLRSGEGNLSQIQSDMQFFENAGHNRAAATRQRSPEGPPRIVRRRID
ncbi:MAG TPA: hypothetical protein VFX23_12220 [Limnobacter sp.]|uniref:hypothetical protein n=1 Tax=Limnobacter sp. TaxID=2003368 RepID=UPI002E314101|nr:hypothetical protein [Limnobacter sp.]HEX5486748.1 hypothetical protein [Limnobacter sp.]